MVYYYCNLFHVIVILLLLHMTYCQFYLRVAVTLLILLCCSYSSVTHVTLTDLSKVGF